MGRGLVEAEDDLRATNPPTNEPLMAALTDDFVRNKYDLKRLMRQIMGSDTYQRSSVAFGINRLDDRYFSHFNAHRLDAEPLLDAIAAVTDVPTEYKDLPAKTRASQVRDNQVASYFLTIFGRPAREKTCACERGRDPSVAQALHLSNGDAVNPRLRAPNGAVARAVSLSDNDAEDQLYLSALCRYPTQAEKTAITQMLANSKQDRRAAIEDMYWAVLTSREFLFDH
jgi:hypothetical protein